MARQSKKQVRSRIERAYYASCTGVQIDIMDIGKVFRVGETAVAEGADDDALKSKIRAFVETIRKN